MAMHGALYGAQPGPNRTGGETAGLLHFSLACVKWLAAPTSETRKKRLQREAVEATDCESQAGADRKAARAGPAAICACAAVSLFTTGRKLARVFARRRLSWQPQGRAQPCCTGGSAAPLPPGWPSMEALVCVFSQLRIREGRTSHPDTPPNIYDGGLGAQQQQCPSAQGSKPKNFRLYHLRGLALYLPGLMQPAGQCETHWLGQLMAGGCLPQPEGTVWPLDLKQGALGSGNSHHSALLEARQPGKYSSSMDPAKGAPSQPGPREGLGLRPKRSWWASEESTCPSCKRTHSGALERP
ncbi:hypothetical protein E2I00_015709 [Balaenoptera physalus]|uniref:Uncharacterized protein n=1 Tax=Balaenoptera physalus TaxID=9770 RepID=A0A6A1Q8W7_BALPH|nr:hypothetical protein E2I00_015709 [Balaenoptera physalus]